MQAVPIPQAESSVPTYTPGAVRLIFQSANIEGLSVSSNATKLFSPSRKLVTPASGVATTWQEVYQFWMGNWPEPAINYHLLYGCAARVDEAMKRFFEPLWNEALNGGLRDWEEQPQSCVAKILLCDQAPRHMFRNTARVLETDAIAQRLANRCAQMMSQGVRFHVEDTIPILLAWLHSETIDDMYVAEAACQMLIERSKALVHLRMLNHLCSGQMHTRVLERFGRYPHRNSLLGRASTPEELEYLEKEAGIWERDQKPESRGGTPAFAVGVTEHYRRVARQLHLEGKLLGAIFAYFSSLAPKPKEGYTGGL